jgi:hypothetical protein
LHFVCILFVFSSFYFSRGKLRLTKIRKMVRVCARIWRATGHGKRQHLLLLCVRMCVRVGVSVGVWVCVCVEVGMGDVAKNTQLWSRRGLGDRTTNTRNIAPLTLIINCVARAMQAGIGCPPRHRGSHVSVHVATLSTAKDNGGALLLPFHQSALTRQKNTVRTSQTHTHLPSCAHHLK